MLCAKIREQKSHKLKKNMRKQKCLILMKFFQKHFSIIYKHFQTYRRIHRVSPKIGGSKGVLEIDLGGSDLDGYPTGV